MQAVKPGRVRYSILLMLFLVTTVTFADRSSLSIAGAALQADLGIDAVLHGFVDMLPLAWAIGSMFLLRLAVGFAGAPCFPGNARIIAAWFPTRERATATAMSTSAQYAATAVFAPLMGWVVQDLGWQYVFFVLGGLGLLLCGLWLKLMHSPREHPRLGAAEFAHIEDGGALIDMAPRPAGAGGSQWRSLKLLLTQRTLVGLYLGQYCNNAITYFFPTWFPVYLVQARGMSILSAGFMAALPAISGFVGGVLGGLVSDGLLRSGYSLTLARKLPIVVGMLLASSIVLCVYAESDTAVIGLMALAFFGKGFGSLGWTLVADTSPRQIVGLSGGLFNTFGNLAAITTPIVVGYLVGLTGSFDAALVFVGANAGLEVIIYMFIVGGIRRIEVDEPPSLAAASAVAASNLKS